MEIQLAKEVARILEKKKDGALQMHPSIFLMEIPFAIEVARILKEKKREL